MALATVNTNAVHAGDDDPLQNIGDRAGTDKQIGVVRYYQTLPGQPSRVHLREADQLTSSVHVVPSLQL